MPLIEGLGDEVTQFLLAVSLIVIAIAAWLSTRIPDAAPVRAVVYVEQSESRPPEVQPQIVLNNTPVVLDPEEANKSDDDTSSETTEVDLLDADIQPGEHFPTCRNYCGALLDRVFCDFDCINSERSFRFGFKIFYILHVLRRTAF